MARNKSNQQQKTSDSGSNGGSRWGTKPKLTWINPRVDKSDGEWLDSHDGEQSLIICEFLDAIPETASLSSKYDTDSTRYLSTLIFAPNDPHSPNIAVSVRGATRIDSLYALSYFVSEKYGWNFTDFTQDETVGRWG